MTDAARYPAIAGLILLATAVSCAKFAGVDVSALYANVTIGRGQVWRLLTSVLPHGNVLHLAFNLYWVWVFGSLIEEQFGHWKTAALVLFLAAGSMGAEFAILDGGIGLSGVVYGFFGLLWVLSRRSPRFVGTIDTNTATVFVVWFFFCIATTVSKVLPVANIAHGMGAALGALVGLSISGPRRQRFATGAGALAALAACLIGATFARPYINLSADRGKDEAYFGSVALTEGRNGDALYYCRESVLMRPKEASYWFNLAIAYDRTGNPVAAKDAFKKAADLAPDNKEFKAINEIRQWQGD